MDVVKKKILKLLEVGVIYPTSDSNWVSPVQVVPKKTGIIVVKNHNDELVPTRVQNGWQLFRLFPNCNCSGGSRKDDFYMPIRNFWISSNALWPLQRPSHFPEVYGWHIFILY
ncbi:hypothetical protein F2P56_012991 [Juglans regia]|uniref:Reverse transcriptase n=1 Tax=Juglans regia TaxID=51240 RepID=A0A834CV54_JUGRE|nr:hypothetical protein F2P56_012991 [Juglans regia]